MATQGPPLQVQTEAELSLDEIREREAAIRKLEVIKLSLFNIVLKKLQHVLHSISESKNIHLGRADPG